MLTIIQNDPEVPLGAYADYLADGVGILAQGLLDPLQVDPLADLLFYPGCGT